MLPDVGFLNFQKNNFEKHIWNASVVVRINQSQNLKEYGKKFELLSAFRYVSYLSSTQNTHIYEGLIGWRFGRTVFPNGRRRLCMQDPGLLVLHCPYNLNAFLPLPIVIGTSYFWYCRRICCAVTKACLWDTGFCRIHIIIYQADVPSCALDIRPHFLREHHIYLLFS